MGTLLKWIASLGGGGGGGYIEGARVYHDADQTTSNGAWFALAFNHERYDTDNIHDNVTNNGRLTCKTAGKYIIAASITFDTDPDGRRIVRFRLNGATIISEPTVSATPSGYCAISATTIYDLAVNDYIELFVLQNSGGNLAVKSIGNHTPEFMMQRIG